MYYQKRFQNKKKIYTSQFSIYVNSGKVLRRLSKFIQTHRAAFQTNPQKKTKSLLHWSYSLFPLCFPAYKQNSFRWQPIAYRNQINIAKLARSTENSITFLVIGHLFSDQLPMSIVTGNIKIDYGFANWNNVRVNQFSISPVSYFVPVLVYKDYVT